MKYLFILGNNPELSIAEILAVLPAAKVLAQSRKYLAVESAKLDCQQVLSRLGGTIKIGLVIGQDPEVGPVLGAAASQTGRFIFGFSYYDQSPSNLGMKIKKLLKEQGRSARLVTSREPALSSVIVTKEKCHDFLVVPGYFAMTCAVQDFKEYGQRDFGRPASDALSGMLPPKAAQMMINLSQADFSSTILDPFCGSGTILSEAMVMGFDNLIGCDNSAKAVADTEKNLAWLIDKLKVCPEPSRGIQNLKSKIFEYDAQKLSEQIKAKSIDAIVTEPYLGPPIRGNETVEMINKIISELEILYLNAFQEFKTVLKAHGRVVIVLPQWHLHNKIYRLNIFQKLEQLGFKRLDKDDLYYSRPDQKVRRQIIILEK